MTASKLQRSALESAMPAVYVAVKSLPSEVTSRGAISASVPASFEVMWLESQFRPGSSRPGPLVLYAYVLLLSLAIAVPLARRFLPRRGPPSRPRS